MTHYIVNPAEDQAHLSRALIGPREPHETHETDEVALLLTQPGRATMSRWQKSR
jgi:hypothetical protein